VVDDEPYMLRTLSYMLTRAGFVVETASDGVEGLARLRALRPPLVLLDVMMPRMNGYEVCEEIRRDPALAGTYVIVLTARGQQADRERGLLGGADEYIVKPFSPREVVERIRSALARAPRRAPRRAPHPEPQTHET
jgi:DNA-binding response OmpR family regulator